MLGLWDMSLLAGILIAAVTAARAVFGKNLSGKTLKILWAIVIMRMLIPLSIQINGLHGESAQTAAVYVYEDSGGTFHNALFAVYFVVAAAIALFFAAFHIRFRFRLRDSILLESFKTNFGRNVRIKTSDRISSPLTYGILRPVILIPKNIGSEKNAVLAHETVHIECFDVLYKLLMTAAVCIHWFDPLAWVMFVLAGHDLEIACDEEVIRRGDIPRKEYALALIGMEERHSFGASFFGSSPLKKRIASVMTLKKFSPVGAVLIAAAMLVFTFYDPEPVTVTVTVAAQSEVSTDDAVYSDIEVTNAFYSEDTVYKAYFFTDDTAE